MSSVEKFPVGIIGASGYTGRELIRILSAHPRVELKVLNSSTYGGKKVSEVFPEAKKHLLFTNYSLGEIDSMSLEVVFLAVPHGVAHGIVSRLKCKVVDLSPDYRFHDAGLYKKAYGAQIDKKTKAVYGLPELFKKEIRKSRVVGNPGCYATGMILSGYPLQKKASYIVYDCVSGWSGAGRDSVYAKDPSLLKDNLIAYKIAAHRHKYEVEQFISAPLSFTPHVIGTFRGMMITAHVLLKKKENVESIVRLYKEFYKGSPLVEVATSVPDIRAVQGTNKMIIGGFEMDENNQLVIVAVLDNLLKGASGEAVQNMNLMLGLKETEGLL